MSDTQTATMRDAIAAIVADAECMDDRRSGSWVAYPDDIAQAILAALPDMQRADPALLRGMVKPLVWDGPNCGIWDGGKRFSNDCAAYKIIWDLGYEETYTAYFGNSRTGIYPTLESAQAAANAHNAAAVLAGLGVE